MIRPQELAVEEQTMANLVGLTNVFESIASMRIAQIHNQVLESQQFFDELWGIYRQIRVDSSFHFGQGQIAKEKLIDKELLVLITGEGGFSGDIDAKLIAWMLNNYDEHAQDIIVIGHHGAVQLAHAGVHFVKYYKLPIKDQDINVSPIVQAVQHYRTTTVYYQTYVSLMVQDVKRIGLSAAVQEQGRTAPKTDDVITESNYIFEPSTFDVIDHLEGSMLHIALSQVILESKLAQYASRFRAMSEANHKAVESQGELHVRYNRAKRSVQDERLKEIINGLRKVQTA